MKHAKSEDSRLFSLWCKGRLHKLPAETFTKISKKAQALVKAGDYQGTITIPVSSDALETFLLACELKQFKITTSNAFQVLDLATEWGVKDLESYVQKYVVEHHLKREEGRDYLGNLLLHLEDDSDVTEDIAGVARNLNSYFDDSRLMDVHPEALFKVLMLAEEHDVDPKRLIAFVMKLFDVNPEKAVPLCLRIDFDRMSDEQREEVFLCREIHELAMGYFLAASMSASRNKAARDLAVVEQRHQRELGDIKEQTRKRRAAGLKEVEDEYERQKQDLIDVIENQRRQIEDLKKVRDAQRQRIEEENRRYDDEMEKLKKELQRQTEIVEEKQAIVDERRRQIQDEIDTQVANLRRQFEEKRKQLEESDDERRSEVRQKVKPYLEHLQEHRDKVSRHLSEDTSGRVSATNSELTEVKATIAAKLVRDQVKFDGFLRDLEKRFEVFDDKNKKTLWGLNSDQVKQAEELVVRIEQSTSASCPINKLTKAMKKTVDAMQDFAKMLQEGQKYE